LHLEQKSMKLSRKHEEVLKRTAKAAALQKEGYTLRYIAETLGYRTEGAIRHLLRVHTIELERSAMYRRNCVETA
jgi:hypothetical protein